MGRRKLIACQHGDPACYRCVRKRRYAQNQRVRLKLGLPSPRLAHRPNLAIDLSLDGQWYQPHGAW